MNEVDFTFSAQLTKGPNGFGLEINYNANSGHPYLATDPLNGGNITNVQYVSGRGFTPYEMGAGLKKGDLLVDINSINLIGIPLATLQGILGSVPSNTRVTMKFRRCNIQNVNVPPPTAMVAGQPSNAPVMMTTNNPMGNNYYGYGSQPVAVAMPMGFVPEPKRYLIRRTYVISNDCGRKIEYNSDQLIQHSNLIFIFAVGFAILAVITYGATDKLHSLYLLAVTVLLCMMAVYYRNKAYELDSLDKQNPIYSTTEPPYVEVNFLNIKGGGCGC